MEATQVLPQKKSESEIKVEETSPELKEKHPLQHTWVLWYLKPDYTKEWLDLLREVVSVDTVEDFWAVFNHIKFPSALIHGDYYFFKQGIKPMWEDPSNEKGVNYVLEIQFENRKLPKDEALKICDNVWFNMVLALIGENFEDLGEFINGASLAVRTKRAKLSLWCGKASVDKYKLIGSRLKEKLEIGDMAIKMTACESLYNDAVIKTKNAELNIVF